MLLLVAAVLPRLFLDAGAGDRSGIARSGNRTHRRPAGEGGCVERRRRDHG